MQKVCFEDWDFGIRYCLVFGICSLGFMTPPNIEQLLKSVHSLYPISLYLLRDMLTHNEGNAGVWL